MIRAQIYCFACGAYVKHSIQEISRKTYDMANLTTEFRAVALPAYDRYGRLLPENIVPERFDTAIRAYQ